MTESAPNTWPRGAAGIYDLGALKRRAEAYGLSARAIRQFRRRLYRESAAPLDALAELEGLPGRPAQTELELVEAHDSQLDGSTKLIFRNCDQLLVEAIILRIQTGRTSLCVSSQVGCAAACRFCATGRMGMARNLRAAEIVEQLVLANHYLRDEGRLIRNVVFMGMGEPMHNYDQVCAAIDIMTDPRQFALSPLRVTVSSVGVVPAMRRLAQERPQIRQALSLHAAEPNARRSLIPLAERYSLADLRGVVAEINAHSGATVLLEISLFAGVNDRDVDADALLEFAEGLKVHFNLIPFNHIEDSDLQASGTPRMKAFADLLRRGEAPVTIRYSLGRDITAACGQLVRPENLAVARSRRSQ